MTPDDIRAVARAGPEWVGNLDSMRAAALAALIRPSAADTG